MQESPYLKERGDMVNKFKKIPFFKAVHENFIKRILSLSKIRTYDPGETIAREGELDSWVYVIIDGEVRVVKHGKEIARMDYNKSGTFGELAAIDGEARSASVIAVTRTVCLATDATFLSGVTPQERDAFFSVFYRLLAEVLASRLRSTDEELIRLKDELERLKQA
ncbi:MAG: cyclic nucleotide-binding domain-containing protein [Nitrospinae bacterium]|nr:cyclic nucleotide-binding domain-containing protein [Nitrospinota bacterium]